MTDLAELGEKAERVSALYARRCDVRRDDDWFALKLSEELGELLAEYLRASGRGRSRGTAGAAMHAKLEDEAADLLAQLLLFCRHNRVDIEAALDRKWFFHLDTPDARGEDRP